MKQKFFIRKSDSPERLRLLQKQEEDYRAGKIPAGEYRIVPLSPYSFLKTVKTDAFNGTESAEWSYSLGEAHLFEYSDAETTLQRLFDIYKDEFVYQIEVIYIYNEKM